MYYRSGTNPTHRLPLFTPRRDTRANKLASNNNATCSLCLTLFPQPFMAATLPSRDASVNEFCSSDKGRPKYHELFASPDADVTLSSSDSILFRLHSYRLHMSSRFFRTLFSLPQPDCRITTTFQTESETLPTHETAEVLSVFFLILCSRPLPMRISDLAESDMLDRVLSLAEAWDAPAVISAIRPALSSPELLARYPLRLYAIASHFGWSDERKVASSYTLALDVFADDEEEPENAQSIKHDLYRLSSKDLLALLKLRRKRCEMFCSLLDCGERFTAGNSSTYQCSRCGVTPIDNRTWRHLKNAMKVEIDRRPLGDGITGKDVHGIGGQAGLGIIGGPEAQAAWNAPCLKEGCGGLNYDRSATIKQIRACVEALPLHVED